MDYATLAFVKMHSDVQLTKDDARLSALITAASRAIDRKLTGVPDPDAVDYLKLESKTETIYGQADREGNIICYPHKPYVSAVAAFSFRLRPFDPWEVTDPGRVAVDGLQVKAYPESSRGARWARVQVQISYTGGLATKPEDLPADIMETAAILAIRYYKEAESGLADSIGIAELATTIYTKAWPVRVLDNLQPFIRKVGWRYV